MLPLQFLYYLFYKRIKGLKHKGIQTSLERCKKQNRAYSEAILREVIELVRGEK